MKKNRREFIQHTAALAGFAVAGMPGNNAAAKAENKIHKEIIGNIKDAGMEMSEAFFFGMEERKVALMKQMAVFGAVGGINTGMVGLPNEKPWEAKAIKAVNEAWTKAGMKFNVIEGPPALGEKTKLGLEGRDEEINNFITFMKNLKQYTAIEVICYNWMPVISWYRTKKDAVGRGGALVTAFDYNDVKDEPMTPYGVVTKEKLWQTLEYFLKAVVPEAEKIGIKLAMHPDDPQVDSIKGISRIMTNVENFKRMADIVKSPSNGITMCQGNFALMGVDIPETIHYFGKRGLIHFVHFRNVKGGKFKFEESFHDEGIIDMYAAMKAYYDIGFKGAIRPDHVPTMAGDSNQYAGYSTIGTLYAFGYIRGLMEAVVRSKE